MNVLMIGGDKRSMERGTPAFERLALQRREVERLELFVWPQVHSLSAIFRAALSRRYDVVTAQDPFWRGLAAFVAARLSGAKLNIQVHTDLDAYRGFRHVLAQFVVRRADTIRVVSQKFKAQVEQIGVRGEIHVLPIFVDVAAYSGIARRAHAEKRILWIGRFEDEKDPLYAIEVLRRVLSAVPDVRLTMLGEGSLARALFAAAEGLPVEFAPWGDPKPHLEIADVVLSTSKHESWGQSIIEALAAGVPVVAPDIGIAREAGAIVAPKERLAEKVSEALANGADGALRLHLLDSAAWVREWKRTL